MLAFSTPLQFSCLLPVLGASSGRLFLPPSLLPAKMWSTTVEAAMAGCSSPISTPSLFSHSNSNFNSPRFPNSFNLPSLALSSPSPSWDQFRSFSLRRSISATSAAVSVDYPPLEEKKLLLEVKDLTAVIAESRQKILNGVYLTVYEGEVPVVSIFFSLDSHFLFCLLYTSDAADE